MTTYSAIVVRDLTIKWPYSTTIDNIAASSKEEAQRLAEEAMHKLPDISEAAIELAAEAADDFACASRWQRRGRVPG
jgi:hypothetical protein